MDHSVQGYLERQSTQLLETLLQKYTGTREEYLVDIISEILEKRKRDQNIE